MNSKIQGTAPLGATLVIISSIFYGSYGIWILLMGPAFGSFTQAMLRSILVVLCLLPIATWRRQLSRLQWRRDAKWLAFSVLSSVFVSAPLYYATQKTGIGVAITLAYIGTILGMFAFGWLFGRERFTSRKFFSTLLGIAGLFLVFTPNLQTAGLFALTAAFVSGLAAGLNVATSKHLPYSPLQCAIITWTGSIFINIPFIFAFHEVRLPALSDYHWLYLLCFAATSLIASSLVIKGVKLIEAGAAGILGLLEVVFGIIFGIIIFHENPGIITLLGAACIMAAAAIPYIQHYNATRGRLEP